MRRAGKKTLAWNKTRAKLKEKFLRMGITHCELRYEGCLYNIFLTFAHSLKRRNVLTQEQLEEVILADINCHNILERMPAEEMARVVREVIAARDQ